MAPILPVLVFVSELVLLDEIVSYLNNAASFIQKQIRSTSEMIPSVASRSTRRNAVTLPICTPQISHVLAQDQRPAFNHQSHCTSLGFCRMPYTAIMVSM